MKKTKNKPWNNINLIQQAREQIEKNEGCRLKVYDDQTGRPIGPGDRLKGHPTIGWGRALDVNGISQSEASQLLQEDLQSTVRAMERQNWEFWNELTLLRKTVLTDMAYNMGIKNLLQFSKMLQALSNKDYNQAAREIKDSKYFRQTGSRAKQNCYIMKYNKFINDKDAKLYFKNNSL